jgi:periplasmic protein CpxP/Spy
MNSIRTMIAGGVIAGLLLGSVALAQGPRDGRPGPRGPRQAMGAQGLPLGALDLTDAQRGLIREITQRHRDDIQQAEQRLRQALTAQREAVQAVPLNEGLIRATAQELAEAQTAAAIARARREEEVRSVLTAEQLERAAKLRAQREQRMQERRERMQQRMQQRRAR